MALRRSCSSVRQRGNGTVGRGGTGGTMRPSCCENSPRARGREVVSVPAMSDMLPSILGGRRPSVPPCHEIAVGKGAARSRRVLSGLLRAAGRSGRGTVLAGLAALVIALPAAAKPAVWSLPSLVRVERSAAAASGSAAILEAARGETESFQIVVRADDEDLKEVSIGVGDLRGPGGAVIPARNHVLYREHYVNIRE